MTGGPSSALASRFRDVRIVVVGSAMVDQITYCDRVPGEGETRRARRYVQGFGGKGANQAVMAARMGANVTFIGCVGDDPMGRATIDNFSRHGVDTAGIEMVPGAPTGVAPIWVDDAGTNRILIAPGANDSLNGEVVLAALERLPTPPAIVLAQLETPQSTSAVAFVWAARSGVCTVLNPAPAADVERSLASGTDWLVPNESEFLELFGAAPDGAVIADASERSRRGMVVTLGSRGAIVNDHNSTLHVGTSDIDVDVVDTTGAGDAFVGTWCVGLAAGLEPAHATRLGCVAGALSVGRAGTQTSFPDADTVIETYHRASGAPSVDSAAVSTRTKR